MYLTNLWIVRWRLHWIAMEICLQLFGVNRLWQVIKCSFHHLELQLMFLL